MGKKKQKKKRSPQAEVAPPRPLQTGETFAQVALLQWLQNSASGTGAPLAHDLLRCASGALGAGASTMVRDSLAPEWHAINSEDTDELDCGWSDPPAGDDSEHQYGDCPPAVAERHLGWAADTVANTSPTHGIGLSPDLLTAAVCGGTTAYSGVLGAARFEHGTKNFAVRVSSPVDDAFWIGVAYCDLVWVDQAPKANPNCIVWSGGDTTAGKSRPGTMRVHGAKFPNKPTFSTGDVIGVEVNYTTKTLSFYLNGARVATFPRVLQGPCAPYFVCSVGGGPAATLVQWPFPSEPTQSEEGGHAPPLAEEEEELAQAHEVVIDGAALEGGGQVIRVAVGCAALFPRPLKIYAIRGGRPKPGLGHQHAAGIKLVAEACNAHVEPKAVLWGGHCEGVQELVLRPSLTGLRGGHFVSNAQTAGSVTLILQAALPCFLLGPARPETTTLELHGGTNVRGAPSADYAQLVLLPLLHRMGATGLSLEVLSRGFYPRGKGSLLVTVTPVARLKPLLLETRGEMVHIQCVVVGGGRGFKSNVRKTAQLANARLVAKYGEGVRISVREAEEPDGSVACRSGAAPAVALASSANDMSKPTMKERKALQAERDRAQESTLQVQLVATTSTGGVIAADCLAETAKNRGSVEPSSVVATAMAKLEEAWTVGGGAVDEHTMDQLILFMALAAGESRILCNAPTSITSLHLETAIQLCSRLTGATFKVEPQPTPMSPDVDSCPRLVTCLGSPPSSTSTAQSTLPN